MWMCYDSTLTSPLPCVETATFENVVNHLQHIFDRLHFQHDHDSIYYYYADEDGARHSKKLGRKYHRLEMLCDDFLNSDKDWQRCPVCFYETIKEAGEEEMVDSYREKLFHSEDALNHHQNHPTVVVEEEDESDAEDVEVQWQAERPEQKINVNTDHFS